MATIPSAKETVRDYGLGITQPASQTAIVAGVCSSGTANVLQLFASPTTLRDTCGEGPAVETAANILAAGGGPVGVLRLTAGIAASNGQVLPTYGSAGTNGSITKSGAGPTITVAGSPNGAYTMRIEITTGGTLGTAVFRWSIDGGSTWVATGVTSAASVQLKTTTFDTGITATMPAGTYVLNETYSWTATPGGGTVSVSGSATVDARLRVEILVGGALGVATFRYSCDGYSGDTAAERTYSETLYVPAGGTFAVPGLGVTLTFVASPVFVAGDFYTCDVQCAAANATNLATGVAALTTDSTKWRFLVVATSKGNGDATAHALLATALQTHLTTLAGLSKHRRGMIAATHTDSAATVAAAYASLVGARVLVAHGQVRRATVKPFSGWAFPVTNAVDVIAARAAGSLPSTDLKRVRSGALTEIAKIFHDEYKTPSSLDDVKVSTLRTYENFAGFYVTQGRLKSPDGSDFKLWPLGICMDIACETANGAISKEIGRGARTETVVINNQSYPGVLDDRDATTIEQSVTTSLISQLVTPKNAEGFDGHIQDVRFKISRTQNFLSTGVIIYEVGIKPLGYVDYITGTFGYVVDLPSAA